jgi:hypothetical protein
LLIAVLSLSNWVHTGKPNAWSNYDTGQAVSCLYNQAQFMGLYTHQMGDFNGSKLKVHFEVPEDVEVIAIMAIGYIGNIDNLAEYMKEKEIQPRERKEMNDLVFCDTWGKSLDI